MTPVTIGPYDAGQAPITLIDEKGLVCIPETPLSLLCPSFQARREAVATLIENLNNFEEQDQCLADHRPVDYWDQSTWFIAAVEQGTCQHSATYECGTRACCAGWTLILDHQNISSIVHEGANTPFNKTSVFNLARIILGIDDEQAHWLFVGNRDLIDIICALRYDLWSSYAMLNQLDRPETRVSPEHLQMIRDTHSFI